MEIFRTIFQTARTLYLLWASGHYSQRGAHSWLGDTSTVLVSRYKYLEIGLLSHNHATISRIFRCFMPDTSTLRCGYCTVHVPLKVHMPFKVHVGICYALTWADSWSFMHDTVLCKLTCTPGTTSIKGKLSSSASDNRLDRASIQVPLFIFLRLRQSWKVSVN